mmetsp:Transcript_5645/g.7009  ORF Transcript_5645/g.7009 Transcript_5645/m.7009 type:complete len:299 (+) Transcript_5645:58-954(+)
MDGRFKFNRTILSIFWMLIQSCSLGQEVSLGNDVIYSLKIHDEHQNFVDTLYVHSGEEAIDVTSDFSVRYKLSLKQQNSIVNHLCNIPHILCTRKKKRIFLFEISIRDSNLKKPLFIKVYDVDNLNDVAIKACSELPSCIYEQDIVNQQATANQQPVELCKPAKDIKNELERRYRLLSDQRLQSDCFYQRLGIEPPQQITHEEAGNVDRNAMISASIRQSFIALSKIYHPDKPGGDSSLFIRLQEAYSTLSDESSRQKYDLDKNYVAPQVQQQPWWAPQVHFPGVQVTTDGFNVFIQF